jgi:hypothetical protein
MHNFDFEKIKSEASKLDTLEGGNNKKKKFFFLTKK